MLKVYIAGFDVFKDNSKEIENNYRNYLQKHNMEGLYPADNNLLTSKNIFDANIELINQADIVIANINDFRGQDVDSGTAFEIGYAFAKNKKIYAYLEDDRSMIEKIGTKDKDGYNVEDFNNPVNLMIAESVTKIIKGTFYDCVEFIRTDINK